MALSHLNTLDKCFFLNTIPFWFGIGFYNEPVTLKDHTWLSNYKDASGNPIITIVMCNFTFIVDSSLLVLRMAVVKESQNLRQMWKSLHHRCVFAIKFPHQTLNIVVYSVAMEIQWRDDGLFPKPDMTNKD